MSAAQTLVLNGQELNLWDVESVAVSEKTVRLGPQARKKIEKSRNSLEGHLAKGTSVYGSNTGVGALFTRPIPPSQQRALSENLVRSHACGVGPALEEATTRAIMFAAVCKFCQGYSGVRLQTVQALCDFLNQGLTPVVPSAGSIGSLTHMAQVGCALLGEGECLYRGELQSVQQTLQSAGLQALELAPGEGLPIISGTSSLVGLGSRALSLAQRLLVCADASAALSFEALQANPNSLHPKVHQLRPHPGQQEVAANLRRLTEGSTLLSEANLQDCLSLRTTPQVHGSTRQTVARAAETVNLELNSATDNPLIFEEEVLSACNAHGEPVSQCMDAVSVALAELGNIAERRTDRLLNFRVNDLPPFLAQDPGLESGLMMLQYTSAYLVSENKVLSHPVSVDSIPMSAFQEDHVNMGTLAAMMTIRVAQNVSRILAIELLTARTALSFRAPHQAAPNLQELVRTIDLLAPLIHSDRALGKDVEILAKTISSGRLRPA